MKCIKKYLVLILALVMMGSALTACGSKSEESKPAADEKTDNTQAQPAQTDAGANQTAEAQEPVTIKIFGSFWPAERTEVTDYFIEQMELATNTKIELEVPPQANYAEKLQLMLVSGEYPDVVNFPDFSDKLFVQGVQDGLFVPINEYLDQTPNIKEHTYEDAFDAVRVMNDENIYMIARNDGFCVRADWLEKSGITPAEDRSLSKDEFVELLKFFTEGDPDGNGKKDTYGMVPVASATGYLEPVLLGAFDLLGWQKTDSGYMNPYYDKNNENLEAALNYSADLWTSGYIHPDWPVVKGYDFAEKFYAGEVGLIPAFAGYNYSTEEKLKEVNPDAACTYISGVRDDDDVLHGATQVPGIWGGWAITKECEHPEKVMEIFDWMLSDEGWKIIMYGKPGLNYEEKDGKIIPKQDDKSVVDAKTNSWCSIFMRRSTAPEFYTSTMALDADRQAEVEGWIKIAMDSVVFSQDFGKKPDISNDAAFIEAENKRQEVMTKVLLGSADYADYQKEMENWYTKGGQEYIDQMNEYINLRNGD